MFQSLDDWVTLELEAERGQIRLVIDDKEARGYMGGTCTGGKSSVEGREARGVYGGMELMKPYSKTTLLVPSYISVPLLIIVVEEQTF